MANNAWQGLMLTNSSVESLPRQCLSTADVSLAGKSIANLKGISTYSYRGSAEQ